jgi:hypothetical protein
VLVRLSLGLVTLHALEESLSALLAGLLEACLAVLHKRVNALHQTCDHVPVHELLRLVHSFHRLKLLNPLQMHDLLVLLVKQGVCKLEFIVQVIEIDFCHVVFIRTYSLPRSELVGCCLHDRARYQFLLSKK